MVTIIDYGSGNLKSISNGFLKIGDNPVITNDPEKIANADYLVLPGVGSFGKAMENIELFKKLILEHINNDKPFLGICLGLQILLSSSEESPNVKGLGVFKGKVKKLPAGEKIPHMGWNQLKLVKKSSILDGVDDKFFYFVHSFHAVTDDNVVSGITNYGIDVTASLHENNIFATQFHPEKSGIHGLKILKNFTSLK
jgi:glutamine amidotransferase